MAILVVDDDPVQCRLLEAMLHKFGYEAVVRDNGEAALALLCGGAGARDFVVKPVGAERLHVSLRNALTTSALEGEIARFKHSRAGTLGFADIITKSANMGGVIRIAEKAAASNIPVLICGESGVGKEL